MSGEKKRLRVSVNSELEAALTDLKKEKFYNASQSEMIRCVLQAALDMVDHEADAEDTCP